MFTTFLSNGKKEALKGRKHSHKNADLNLLATQGCISSNLRIKKKADVSPQKIVCQKIDEKEEFNIFKSKDKEISVQDSIKKKKQDPFNLNDLDKDMLDFSNEKEVKMVHFASN
jgi:hypothetical protein